MTAHCAKHAGSGEEASSSRWLHWTFAALSAAFGVAAGYHALAMALPSIAEPSPMWRHALFVVINAGMGLMLVRRPRWFALVFALLTLQQLYSHGTYGWQVWADQHRVDWSSVIVLVGMPAIGALLVVDGRRAKSARAIRDP